jgi:hypothetical protein
MSTYRFTEVAIHQRIISPPVNTLGACDGRQSISESWSPDVSICRYVRNYPLHTQRLPVGVGQLSGKLQFGAVGAEAVAAESPG